MHKNFLIFDNNKERKIWQKFIDSFQVPTKFIDVLFATYAGRYTVSLVVKKLLQNLWIYLLFTLLLCAVSWWFTFFSWFLHIGSIYIHKFLSQFANSIPELQEIYFKKNNSPRHSGQKYNHNSVDNYF